MGYKSKDRCLEKVSEDEPIFVLRAQDVTSVPTMRFWFQYAMETLTPEHADETVKTINEFLDWQHNHPQQVKRPD